ncbi:hypothetical protein [Vibrio parahaemolyticus]|uniref:hypothetical protein n=1 Tax=Vibrio parahaemolyticus TaxID=670 RepID=UPI00235DF696|nr:hypothetical protein [Vibrio parahaemolyticus]
MISTSDFRINILTLDFKKDQYPLYKIKNARVISNAIGALSGLSSARKYELQIEFQHADETGLQWISVAKTNNKNAKNIFEKQVISILEQVT